MAAISFKSVGDTSSSEKFKSSATLSLPYGVKTPLRKGAGELFEMSVDMRDQVHDNLKNLILTNAGERLGKHSFGANLRPLMSEKLAKDDFDAQAMSNIKNSVKSFMPYIELKDFESRNGPIDPVIGSAQIDVYITYSVDSIGLSNKQIIVSILPVA